MNKTTQKCISFEGLDMVDLERNPRESQLSQSNAATEENIHDKQRRREMKRLFKKFDRNRNGYLEIRELKMLLNNGVGKELPRGLAKRLLKLGDTDRNGRLDFEEFYEMSKTYSDILNQFINSYCNMVVAPRRTHNQDQTDGQYEQKMTCCPPKVTMLIFSLLEIITFAIDVWYKKEYSGSKSFSDVGLKTDGPFAKAMMYDPSRRYELWRFITYMFVHAGTSHLIANLLIQFFLGTALELVHSWWRITCIYLAGVLAASIGTSVWDTTTKFCGASGGVYALITAHIATVILNYKEMDFPGIHLFVFTFYCTVDLGQSIYNHIFYEGDQVGYMGHLCGAMAGLLVGIGVLQNLSVKNWETKLWWICVTVYLALMFSGICVHLFYPGFFELSRRSR